MGAIVSIALLHVLVGLLLLPLLALLLRLTVLPRAARPSYDAAGKTANGCPSPGATTAPRNAPDNRTTGTTEDATCHCSAADALLFL